MAKLDSVPPYPKKLNTNAFPVNLVLNKDSRGKLQIAKASSGPKGTDYEILHEFDSEQAAGDFARLWFNAKLPGLT